MASGGPRHRPEFTMLEWYQVGGTADSAIAWLRRICREILGQRRCDVVTYRRLIQGRFGVDPIDATIQSLRDVAERVDPSAAAAVGDDRDGLLDVLMEAMTANLGIHTPLIVTDYPLWQAALARPSETRPELRREVRVVRRGPRIGQRV